MRNRGALLMRILQALVAAKRASGVLMCGDGDGMAGGDRWRRAWGRLNDSPDTQSCHRDARHSRSATMSREAVIHAYRHVLRHSLRAIQFSKPARYTLRDRLRLAFRKGSVTDLEPLKIKNTVEFLHYATRENGMEHRIVKNLLFVWWMQAKGGRGKPRHKAP
jgi:hypothetical protein